MHLSDNQHQFGDKEK